MQDYNVDATGYPKIPDPPKTEMKDNGAISKEEKAATKKAEVQKEITAEVTGAAKKVAKAGIEAGIDSAAIMGFIKQAPELQLELSPEMNKVLDSLAREQAKLEAMEIERQAQAARLQEIQMMKDLAKEQAEIKEQAKQFAPPSYVEGHDPELGDIRYVYDHKVTNEPGSAPDNPPYDDFEDSKYGVKEPSVYYRQFIEENGGEPLTKSQIREKYREIKKEFRKEERMSSGDLSEKQIRDFDMQRYVLRGMLHGETFEKPVAVPPKDTIQEKASDVAPNVADAEPMDAYEARVVAKPTEMVKPDFDKPASADGVQGDELEESEYGVKEPKFYYDQFIEENGGEPLTKKQIRGQIREINRTLKDPETIMTDLDYHELQMKRNVLIDMLHGETYE